MIIRLFQFGHRLFQDDGFVSGPNLPTAVSHHCLVALSNIKSMLIGGQVLFQHIDNDEEEFKENLFSNKVWVYDWNQMKWKQMKRLKEGRHSHSCSKTLDEKLIVVAGGMTALNEGTLSVEVFDVAIEEWKKLGRSRLLWQVIGVPFIIFKGVPALFQSDKLKQITPDDDENIKSSKIMQMSNDGSFSELMNCSTNKAVVRPYGVVLVVPELVVCL